MFPPQEAVESHEVGRHHLDTTCQDQQSTVQVSASPVKQPSPNLAPMSKPGIVSRTGTSFHTLAVSPPSSRYVWGSWHLEEPMGCLLHPEEVHQSYKETEQFTHFTYGLGARIKLCRLSAWKIVSINSICKPSLKVMQKQHHRTWAHECHR